MRPVPVLVFAVLATVGLGLLPSCKRHTPPPPPAPAPAPVTGWQADDSQAAAEALVSALAEGKWAVEFTQGNGRPPAIAAPVIDDRSGDQVPTAEVAQVIGDAISHNPRLRLAVAGDADAGLTVIIGLRQTGGDAQFTIDARAIDAKNAEVRWGGGIQRPRRAPVAPAPVVTPAAK